MNENTDAVTIHIRFNADIRVLADLIGESDYNTVSRMLQTNPYPIEMAFHRFLGRTIASTGLIITNVSFFCIDGIYARFTVEMRGLPEEFIKVMSDKGLLRTY